MAFEEENVRAAINGNIYIAPKGTVAPVDLVSAWGPGWVDLGYLSEDGVEMNYSTETTDIPVWQSLSPVRKILTGVDLTLAFTAMELKKAAVTLYFPSSSINTTGGVSTLAIPSAPAPDERAIGFEWVDGAITNRLVVARSEVTERGSITFSKSGASSLNMTASAYATSAPEIATWLSNDPSWA
ncbi:hypothetical protein [Embleya sp. NPDC020630]|uniref:phage tail tube protein n=1 Tax=Embleya sp. NPDC020630 TaxID=3363979 RepID=UPI0037912ED2